jgi:hypothetical protein
LPYHTFAGLLLHSHNFCNFWDEQNKPAYPRDRAKPGEACTPFPSGLAQRTFDRPESDGFPPNKKQKCDAWTTTEMEQLTDYYLTEEAKNIKLSDDNHPSHPKRLKRFTFEEIAVGINARSAIPVEKVVTLNSRSHQISCFFQ